MPKYKITHPNIVKELTRRSTSGKNTEIFMPTVRLVSTVDMGAIDSTFGDSKYFCVGLHGYEESTENVMDMFNITNSQYPIVGYTFNSSGPRIIRANDDSSLETDISIRNLSVPPPGITSLKISKNSNGRIHQLIGNIIVPSAAQYEFLQKYFLIPGIGILAEYVNNTSNIQSSDFLYNGTLPPSFIDLKLGTQALEGLLQDNAIPFIQYEKLLKKIYESDGNYGIFFGRMGNFTSRLQGNEYSIQFTATGVGDASMGITLYETTTQNQDSKQQISPDIKSWFTPITSKTSSKFMDLLLYYINTPNDPVSKHVYMAYPSGINITQSTVAEEFGTDTTGANKLVGPYKNPIFVTWPFFVNIILNIHVRNLMGDGSKSILLIDELENYDFQKHPSTYDNPNEPKIGTHSRLRSIDGSVMILYNQSAQSCAMADPEYRELTGINTIAVQKALTEAGSFYKPNGFNYGKLSSGVWLNANLIADAFSKNNTTYDALSYILREMNRASSNYWGLALDYDDSQENYNITGYQVVDNNFGDASSTEIITAYSGSYIFNKPNFSGLINGQQLLVPNSPNGSETLDVEFDLILSKVLMASAIFSTNERNISNANSSVDQLRPKQIINGQESNIPIFKYDLTCKEKDQPLRTTQISNNKEFGDLTSLMGNEFSSRQSIVTYVNTTEQTKLDTKREELQKQLDTEYENLKVAKTDSEKTIIQNRINSYQIGIRELNDAINRSEQAKLYNINSTKRIDQDSAKKIQHLQFLFHMIELFPEYMRNKMKKTVDNDINNNFAINGMLPYKLILTLPGITGIRAGEIIRIARLPRIFKDAAFMVLGTTDTVDIGSGWTTSIEGKLLPATMFKTRTITSSSIEECATTQPFVLLDSEAQQIMSTTGTIPQRLADYSIQQFINATPWSAAFISYVVKSKYKSFVTDSAHVNYANKNSSTMQILDPKTTTLRIGDIIIKNRNNNNNTFDDGGKWSGESHGDIVVRISPTGASATAIGGNLASITGREGDVVREVNVAIKDGKLIDNNYFVILRVPDSNYRAALEIVFKAQEEYNYWKDNDLRDNPYSKYGGEKTLERLQNYYNSVGLSLPNYKAS
jgi:hypothetical protein